MPKALFILRVVSSVSAALAVAAILFVYLGAHLPLVDLTVGSLRSLEASVGAGEWELIKEYYEVVRSFESQRGLLGFLIGLTREGGALVLVLPLVFWLVERIRGAGIRRGAQTGAVAD